jgi:hypothetical protein
MPTIKNLSGTSGARKERLVIIDEILSKTRSAISKENLLRMVNNKLKNKIGGDTLNKDIPYLKRALGAYSKKTSVNVSLICERNVGYFYSIKGFKLFAENVDEDDKNLLLYATSLFDVFSGTTLHQKFNDIVKRLIDDSITIDKKNIKLPKNIVQIDKGIHLKSKEWLQSILDAILKQECIEVDYTNNKKERKKKILSPYIIKQYNNKWHMIAYDHSSSHNKKINVFLMDNINSIESSNKSYFIDEHFNAEDYFKYSIGIWHEHDVPPIKVKLEFSNEGYGNLFNSIQNNPIHHLQKCAINKTGNKMIVELEVYESVELYSIIRNFGSSVKVLEPKSVADKVMEGAKKVVGLYE